MLLGDLIERSLNESKGPNLGTTGEEVHFLGTFFPYQELLSFISFVKKLIKDTHTFYKNAINLRIHGTFNAFSGFSDIKLMP